VIDPRAGGRGAWLCASPSGGKVSVQQSCLAAAASSGAFDRAFRRRVDPDVIAAVVGRMSPDNDGGRPRNRR
jgi:predicted RNA-binding protein YlxR (DUF448 family)